METEPFDLVRFSLEKDPSERTPQDVQLLFEFTRHLQVLVADLQGFTVFSSFVRQMEDLYVIY